MDHIRFEKWQGCLNDFIVIHADSKSRKNLSTRLQQKAPDLCSKNGSGIGADGILLISQVQDSSSKKLGLDIINSDGSLAANCGNGLRCAAGSIHSQNTTLKKIEIDVQGIVFECNLIATKSNLLFSVQMPQPKINQPKLLAPAKKNIDQALYPYTSLHSIDVGNQHLVLFFEQNLEQLSSQFYQLGSNIQTSSHWDGINLHFCTLDPTSENMDLIEGQSPDILVHAKTWERGVGPTSACGSGAVSVAYAHQHNQGIDSNFLTGVRMPGGTLYIRDLDQRTELIGPAVQSFSGHIDLV